MNMLERSLNDIVRLIKPDGQQFEDIKARVSNKDIIYIYDVSLPIEEGDTIERVLSNGLVEKYLVLDRGYQKAPPQFRTVNDHYSVKVRKLTTIEIERPATTTIYHLHGHNSRVNIHSHDESHNVVNLSSGDLFERIKAMIESNVKDEEQKQEIITSIEEMKETKDTRTFTEKYRDFISLSADYLGLLAPFMPALAQLLK